MREGAERWNNESMKMPFQKIVIVGIGLMGGSLGLAIKQRRLAREVSGVDTSINALKAAERLKAIDCGETDLEKAVVGADLVILAIPVGQMEGVAIKLKSLFHHKTVVTDVGSVKGG